MFKDLFNSIATNLIPATVLFLLFLLALGAFVRRSDIPALAAGLARLLLLIFVSPLNFLRKTILEVVDSERREEYEGIRSDQFLIRRHISSLKAGLVVGAILLLALGLGGAWVTLPSRSDFRNLREKREFLVELGRLPESLKAELSQLEQEWLTLKTTALTKRQLQSEQQLLSMRTARLALETRLPASLQTKLGPQTVTMPYSEYGSRESLAYQFYQANGYVQGDAVANSYFSSLYQERWLARQFEEIDQRRREGQPLWEAKRTELASVPNRVQQTKYEISEKESQIRSDRRLAVSIFAGTLGTFYIFAWVIGLLIEGLSLVVRVAGDIRVLRDQQASLAPIEQRNDTQMNPVSLFRS